jgi:Fe-S cluster assembly ATP-binding protein
MSLDSLLSAKDLHIAVSGTEVISGLNLSIGSGEIHAIMGPNGSGKSTFVNTLMGNPVYDVTSGSVTFNDRDLLSLDAAARAKAGLFLAFQYPKEISGVTLRSFLFTALRAQSEREGVQKIMSPVKFQAALHREMEQLGMDTAFSERALNKGFSGGEKKKAEVLQMAMLKPRLALLDETDSGLDVDALKIVADGVNRMRAPDFSAVIVTHYARLLQYIVPDYAHVMIRGKIVESGGADLAHHLEKEGYKKYGIKEDAQ